MSNNSQKIIWNNIRAEKYNQLQWVHDQNYLEEIKKSSLVNKEDVILDLGTGTGIVARTFINEAKKIFAMDISQNMLSKIEKDDRIIFLEWDARARLFDKEVFNKIIARMFFHNLEEGCELVLSHCFYSLKPKGKIIIAEGLPPSDDPEVVEWYNQMFKIKEPRLVFNTESLKILLKNAGFKNISYFYYKMPSFNIINWLTNSGLSQEIQQQIIQIHLDMPEYLKNIYNLRVSKDSILVETRNIIITGEK